MQPEATALAALIPMVLSLIATPAIIRLAKRIGAVDKPDDRKVHKSPIPRLGGASIALAFGATAVSARLLFPEIPLPPQVNWYLVGASMILITGVGTWDDMHPVSAGRKFLAQVVVASLVYWSGLRLSGFDFPLFAVEHVDLGLLSYPATILWIVGITNAINLIDGLDGLASGITLVALGTIYAVAANEGNTLIALTAITLAGAVAGFLRYNFYPARVFLGDSGSLFLGFALSILALIIWSDHAKGFTLIIPSVVLALPIADTSLAVIRRYLRTHLGAHPEREITMPNFRSLFLPDRSHIHHRLIALGLSHRDAVLLLYGVSGLLGISAYLMHVHRDSVGTLVLVLVLIAILVGIHNLRYHELPIHRNGIMLRFYHRFYTLHYTQRTVFQLIVDSLFVFVSFGASAKLLQAGRVPGAETLLTTWPLPLIVVVQLLSFWFTGLYKETTKLMGVGDALRIVRSVSAGSVASAFTGVLLLKADFSVPHFVLGFFLLLTFIGTSRFSYTLLSFWLHRDAEGKKRALIFGANTRGLILQETILSADGLDIVPVGFLDGDPRLEDKRINGFPIFGSYWRLEQTFADQDIQCLILVDQDLTSEELGRISRSCARAGVEVRHFNLTLDPIEGLEGGQLKPGAHYPERKIIL
jgi:UDP-GlcNAc:undecaprenyl-phosphate/decaprenyl-phosphate GlcNAc-1-phosphate transferase